MLGLSGTSFGECFHCLSQLPWLESGLGASPQLCLAWAGCLLDRRTPVACVPCTVTSPVFCEHVLVFAGFRSAAQSGLPDLSPLPASHRSTLHQVVASCGKQATTISFGEATSQTLQRKIRTLQVAATVCHSSETNICFSWLVIRSPCLFPNQFTVGILDGSCDFEKQCRHFARFVGGQSQIFDICFRPPSYRNCLGSSVVYFRKTPY